jgi:hypothetical protein
MHIPGPAGPQGIQGIPGTGGSGTGGSGMIILMDGEAGEDAPHIPGPAGPAGTSGTGGSASPFNVSLDTHTTAVPAFPATDYFEGATLDTAGTRFSGATPWGWLNQGSATAVLAAGAVFISGNSDGHVHAIIQAAPSTPWAYVARVALFCSENSDQTIAGLLVYNGGTGALLEFGLVTTSALLSIFEFTNPTTFSAILTSAAVPPGAASTVQQEWLYLRIANDGTNLTFGVSYTGIPGTFYPVATTTIAAFIGAVTHIGIVASAQTAINGTLCDTFLRVA